MRKKYESYNAGFPLSYYEIGEIYSFYGSTSSNTTPASEEQIKRFAEILNEVHEDDNDAIKPVEGFLRRNNRTLQRYYAVVVGKEDNYIIVMFENNNGGRKNYLLKKYITSKRCVLDGKDWIPTETSTSYENTDVGAKVGGITKVSGDEKKVGGITRSGNTGKESTGIGGITLANKEDGHLKSSHGINRAENTGKVGGITRRKKVGGITRSNK